MTDPQNRESLMVKVKEGIAVLREGVIFLAIIILLIQPQCIGEIAKEAGIKSGFGLEFVQQLQQSQEETGRAQAALEVVSIEMDKLKRELRTLSQSAGPSTNPTILVGEIRRLARNADSLERKSAAIKPFLQNSVRLQTELLRKVPSK